MNAGGIVNFGGNLKNRIGNFALVFDRLRISHSFTT